MSKPNSYEKHFIILDKDDMDKLSAGSFCMCPALEDDEGDSPIFLFTEEGYKKFKGFWSEGNLLD